MVNDLVGDLVYWGVFFDCEWVLSLSYDYAGSEHTDSSQVKLGLVSRF
ncbi:MULTISPECIES: hypothetical protein [Moraxella]|jgi:hypothetical protein|nr:MULTISPECIES: hypothetical protein [Moraxella]MBE9578971.1 hypothetical protein [Moraxella sp. K1664]MBE9588316.1 hypothetical protein [Moraxella sp. K1630]MBE9596473.1 hypothetical protein [Moraxella sp. K2450]MDH9218860.1 hypothetical protein [Moraxella lacunata]